MSILPVEWWVKFLNYTKHGVELQFYVILSLFLGKGQHRFQTESTYTVYVIVIIIFIFYLPFPSTLTLLFLYKSSEILIWKVWTHEYSI
jgi:hypothetical protein